MTGPEVTDTGDQADPVGVTEPVVTEPVEVIGAAARIVEGEGRSVYAGAMLLHPFLDRVGAGGVLSALRSGPARCYDTTAVALAATFALALGSSSLEGSKHLQLRDAGMLIGIERFPHLRTLRPRLGALADDVDPLAVQVALAKAMLAADSEQSRRACSSSMSISLPTQARGRSPRGGTRGGVTPSPGAMRR